MNLPDIVTEIAYSQEGIQGFDNAGFTFQSTNSLKHKRVIRITSSNPRLRTLGIGATITILNLSPFLDGVYRVIGMDAQGQQWEHMLPEPRVLEELTS